LLHCVLHLRSAEQSDPASRGRASLDCAHHDHVGRHLVGHDVREGTDLVLHAALPSWRGRSRILPGNDSLPYVLVPERCTRPRRGAIHDGNRNRGGDRKPDIRALAPIKRRRRTGRMAMVVLDRGHAIHSSCIRYVGVLTGWTWQSILAYCPREKV